MPIMKFMITDDEIELGKHQIDAVKFITTRSNSLINYE